jgi:hypothetical protein
MTNVVNLDEVSAVYSGRHGCCCGCNGNHTSDPSRIKRTVNKMNKLAAEGATVDDQRKSGYGYIAVETPTRLHIAYTDGRTS